MIKAFSLGEIRNGYPVLPKEERKTICWCSDDLRFNSGVATVSREIIKGTCHYFNYIYVGGAIQHPELGKVIDFSTQIQEETGVPDVSIKIIPTNGYGDQNLIRKIMEVDKPDAILHFTDPRYWLFLYQMEHEIRTKIPIVYINIWDDLPFPKYNTSFYESCDLLLCISKQTKVIVDRLVGALKEPWQIKYFPHGINEEIYKPLDEVDLLDTKERLFGNKKYDFVMFFNSRNMKRKSLTDIMLAYDSFCGKLTKEQKDKVCLLLHTQPIDNNGTDLITLKNDLCSKDINVIFDSAGDSPQSELNKLYNIADVTLNVSSAEGWGLSATESLMAGTPVLINATGGLQDQVRFEDENGDWLAQDEKFPSNSVGKYKKHGKWAYVIFPVLNLVGSVPTPYIYDSSPKIGDIAAMMMNVYVDKNRKQRGLAGREWVTSTESKMSAKYMNQDFVLSMNELFEKFIPRPKFELIDVNKIKKEDNRPVGVYDELINEWK
jgi:glycosyltransferase involved in cell wall biosynthesis